MTTSLSGGLRGRVIAAIEDRVSTWEAARRYRIGISRRGGPSIAATRDRRDGDAQAGPAVAFEDRRHEAFILGRELLSAQLSSGHLKPAGLSPI
jgi:hypothetical protein